MTDAADQQSVQQVQPSVAKMREARNSPAVLKLQLVTLRGQLPNMLIFVFEGDDDKLIYFHWARRVRPEIDYEPFVCRGKKYVLLLRDVVMRDLAGLKRGVYFFIDSDYDDPAFIQKDEAIYITPSYSVENYLVAEGVLNELLRNEFHCHAHPEVRQPIIDLFKAVYGKYLVGTKEINRRAFIARRLGIKIPPLPERLRDFAKVALRDVEITAQADEVVSFDREPTDEEVAQLTPVFDALSPETGYRGKFACRFFERWLDELADDYSSDQSVLFGGIERSAKVRRNDVTLSSFAAKSHLPPGLGDFILAAGV